MPEFVIQFLFFLLLFVLLILVGLPVFALPATLTLPRGRRPGLPPLTLAQAREELLAGGKSGVELVEAARALVGERMQYCRRNSFDSYARAFERGYGYCQQSAYALAALLTGLGFSARVVTATQNRFPNGKVTGHAWVRVWIGSQGREIDPLYYSAQSGGITFRPLGNVFEYTPFFRLLAGWGSTAVNAYRYYRSGKDHE